MREDRAHEYREPAGKQEMEPQIYKSSKENLYDKIPLSKKQLDIIIAILIAAIIVFFVFGALIGNNII
jgi:hypothetical protein